MKIKLGQCWIVRLTKCEMAVRIDDYSPKGGWETRSLSHGRRIWVRHVDQLIRRCDSNGLHLVADETEPNRRSTATPPEPRESTPVKTEAEVPRPTIIKLEPQTPTLLDAAVIVLRENRKGLSTKEIIAAVQEKGLWNPSGKTPWLTLHTALSREIETKGTASRFKKSKERGKFMLR